VEHSELLRAFLKHIDDATDPRTVITFSEQSDEVANPHVSEDEDQPHLQRSTPGAACRVEVFPNAGSSKGPSSSFEEYAGYSFENPWVLFADAEEFKLIQWFVQSQTPKTKLMITTILGLASLATIRHKRSGAYINNQRIDIIAQITLIQNSRYFNVTISCINFVCEN